MSAVRRLTLELSQIEFPFVEGFSSEVEKDSYGYKLKFLMKAPQDCPYVGHNLPLIFRYDDNHPFAPPKIYFEPVLVHPNVDRVTGQITLKEKNWNIAYTTEVLLCYIYNMLRLPVNGKTDFQTMNDFLKPRSIDPAQSNKCMRNFFKIKRTLNNGEIEDFIKNKLKGSVENLNLTKYAPYIRDYSQVKSTVFRVSDRNVIIAKQSFAKDPDDVIAEMSDKLASVGQSLDETTKNEILEKLKSHKSFLGSFFDGKEGWTRSWDHDTYTCNDHNKATLFAETIMPLHLSSTNQKDLIKFMREETLMNDS